MTKQVVLTVNGERVSAAVEPRTHLADLLREQLRLTGTHLGCEHGVCGACTVLLDGEPVRSCITLAVACEGREVRTIEGFDGDPLMGQLRAAFSRQHALQCGFCTPGMLIAAREICRRLPGIGEARVRDELAGNLCRCTGYQGIVDAVLEVAAGPAARAVVAGPVPASAPVQAGAAAMPLAGSTPRSETAAPPATGEGAGPERQGWQRIAERFVLDHAVERAWQAFKDPRLLAGCLPGAEIIEQDGGSVKGRIRIRFGPMRATFEGAATLALSDDDRRGVLRGAGRDALSASRARGDIAYALVAESGDRTAVNVTLDFQLEGVLAQFSRGDLTRDFARRLIASFAANMNAQLGGRAAPPADGAQLNAGRLVWQWLWSKFKSLFGGRRS